MSSKENFKSALHVQEGINEPDSINPYLDFSKLKRKRVYTVEEYLKGILAGDRVLLSQAITLIESSNPRHYATAQALIEACLPYANNSIRIGITGVPGG